MRLSTENPVSKFAFKFNLYRYSVGTSFVQRFLEWSAKEMSLKIGRPDVFEGMGRWTFATIVPGSLNADVGRDADEAQRHDAHDSVCRFFARWGCVQVAPWLERRLFPTLEP